LINFLLLVRCSSLSSSHPLPLATKGQVGQLFATGTVARHSTRLYARG
jgi:hypothetical protein